MVSNGISPFNEITLVLFFVLVTDKSSSHHQVNVKKLSSLDLKALADSNISLSELYKLKEILKSDSLTGEFTYNNLSDIANLPNADLSGTNAKEKVGNIIDIKVHSTLPTSSSSIPSKPIEPVSVKIPNLDKMSDNSFSEAENISTNLFKPLEAAEEEEELEG